jgi:four helix bundle protein
MRPDGGQMTPEELRERLTAFAVECVTLCVDLRKRPEARQIADQLSASATSAAANYRAASRARSRREFVSKLAVAVEESDESIGWLEIIVRSRLADTDRTVALRREASEVLAILAASRRTAARKINR